MLTAARSPLTEVVTRSGWRLKVDSVETANGTRYDASLTSPEGHGVYVLVFWPDLARVAESVCAYLKGLGDWSSARTIRVALETRR